jgi:CubicO group peptidase (beta-lactamase class C family)
VFDGKRYISESAVAQMTTRQTSTAMKQGYGLGWKTENGRFGHGGAYGTEMWIDPSRKRIAVFLVQHAGFPGDGQKSHETFLRASQALAE